MALNATVKKLLNTLTPGAKTARLGDLIDQATTKAAFVPNAAGANPTKAEFDALLASLQAAGKMHTS